MNTESDGIRWTVCFLNNHGGLVCYLCVPDDAADPLVIMWVYEHDFKWAEIIRYRLHKSGTLQRKGEDVKGEDVTEDVTDQQLVHSFLVRTAQRIAHSERQVFQSIVEIWMQTSKDAESFLPLCELRVWMKAQEFEAVFSGWASDITFNKDSFASFADKKALVSYLAQVEDDLKKQSSTCKRGKEEGKEEDDDDGNRRQKRRTKFFS